MEVVEGTDRRPEQVDVDVFQHGAPKVLAEMAARYVSPPTRPNKILAH
jgi:hypothetical protein